jgi:hypothetical protein
MRTNGEGKTPRDHGVEAHRRRPHAFLPHCSGGQGTVCSRGALGVFSGCAPTSGLTRSHRFHYSRVVQLRGARHDGDSR